MKITGFRMLMILIFILFCSQPGSTSDGEPLKNGQVELKPNFDFPHGQNHQPIVISTGTSRTRQIGMDIMIQGGNAIDGALACTLSRIVEDMGRIISFAGIFMMVYYEAATGKTYSLNACFKTCLEEADPLSIPDGGIPNPRSVMVPGFMAGLQAAHERFGRLSQARVFAPAIDLAANGFVLTGSNIAAISGSWNVLGVLPETRAIFLKKPYGLFNTYEDGDTFRQPQLAETLRLVAEQGAAYMYTGAWGQKLVEVVRDLGGHLSNLDMETYEPVWADPIRTTYNGYDIHALGYPSLGSMGVVMGINLMECAGLSQLDHCSQSALALYRLLYCSRVGEFFYAAYAPEIVSQHIPQGHFDYHSRADKDNAALIWEKIQSGEWRQIEIDISRNGNRPPDHSEAVIAVDREGNVVSICHTINANNWGNSGIFIDGVSIPGAAYHQKARMHKAGPGEYCMDTTNPLLILRNGRPAMASSCIGSTLHCNTVQNLYNMLTFGMTAEESRDTPKFQTVDWGTLNHNIGRNVFDQSLIDAVENMGLGITLVDEGFCEFCWIGILFPN